MTRFFPNLFGDIHKTHKKFKSYWIRIIFCFSIDYVFHIFYLVNFFCLSRRDKMYHIVPYQE